MNYFKVLKWESGAGGDTLIACALLSNPTINSNILINSLSMTTQGRTHLVINPSLTFENIKNMAEGKSVSFRELSQELDNMRLLKESYLLKSHIMEFSTPYDLHILPTHRTLPFFFKARFSKLSKYIAKYHTDVYASYKKDPSGTIKKKVSNYQWHNISYDHNLTIEDLILKNYNKMQDTLCLSFNKTGIEYFETWVERQKELYWEELKILFN